MPKATVTKTDGTKVNYEPTYIDPEIQKTMIVHFNAYSIFAQNLRAHELGVLIYMLSQHAINPQEQMSLSAILAYFGRDDDIDLLEAILKILQGGLMKVNLQEGETLEDIINMLKKAIFDLVLQKRQIEEQLGKEALYAASNNRLH